ncbi:MAG: HAD family phosphatase [Bacteroidia bacterium]|nr:HAD family phosphatase [Bacteroidia bacterium]
MNSIFNINSKVRLAIFDLGGIIMPIRMEKTALAFAKLGAHEISAHVTASHAHDGIFNTYQNGNISTPDFLKAVRTETGVSGTDEQIRDAWNAMLHEPNTDRLNLIKEIAKHTPTVLLSNSNDMHIVWAREHMQPFGGFESFFLKTYFSHEVHLSKPDPKIYELVLHEMNVNAQDAVFFDDSPLNIDAAKALGIDARLVEAL